jgi:tetratricopeptide (TPR) repeat protein
MPILYEPLRLALRKYADGVHLVGPPATEQALRAAAERLGRPLPASYEDFLRSFDGASLFNELIVLHGAADPALGSVGEGQVRIGATPEGALWMDGAGVIRLVDEEMPDPIIAGTDLERFLSALLSREGLIHDREGEFRGVIDEEGDLLLPVRRKRVQAGQKHDPLAALYLLEEAELLLMEREAERAVERLERATALDPQAGPAWELLSALHREAGRGKQAEAAALSAAAATPDPFLRASRLLDAAQSAQGKDQAAHAAAARQADPEHAATLLKQARAALAQGDREEAERLWARLGLLGTSGLAEPLRDDLAAFDREMRTRESLRVI